MKYHRNTACVHLYMNPDENQNFRPNIYIDGEICDLKALIVTAARMNDNFYNALFESTQWIMRDELGAEQVGKAGE